MYKTGFINARETTGDDPSGMRITVYDVLSYLAAGMTYEEILDDFPYLTMEDILACLSYAADREKQTLIVK